MFGSSEAFGTAVAGEYGPGSEELDEQSSRAGGGERECWALLGLSESGKRQWEIEFFLSLGVEKTMEHVRQKTCWKRRITNRIIIGESTEKSLKRRVIGKTIEKNI